MPAKRTRRYSGNYQDCIRFEEPVTVVDSGAGRNRSFSPVAGYEAVMAEVDPYFEGETFNTQQTKGATGYKIRCHWFPGLQASWRIYNISTEETYAILGFINVGNADREWELTCVKSQGRS